LSSSSNPTHLRESVHVDGGPLALSSLCIDFSQIEGAGRSS